MTDLIKELEQLAEDLKVAVELSLRDSARERNLARLKTVEETIHVLEDLYGS